MTRRSTKSVWYLGALSAIIFVLAWAAPSSSAPPTSSTGDRSTKTSRARQEQILLGRAMVVSHACGECHGGGDDPGAAFWLDGMRDTILQQFRIGPFVTRAKNITPDNTTGIGRFSERQIFNALRYGLRPEETADVEIKSTVPGQGNFPLHPHYLAPPMPWTAWRNMSDKEIYAIAAYLKDGVKPVSHKVQDSDGPPDFWADAYTVDKIGPYPVRAFPTINGKK